MSAVNLVLFLGLVPCHLPDFTQHANAFGAKSGRGNKSRAPPYCDVRDIFLSVAIATFHKVTLADVGLVAWEKNSNLQKTIPPTRARPATVPLPGLQLCLCRTRHSICSKCRQNLTLSRTSLGKFCFPDIRPATSAPTTSKKKGGMGKLKS